MWNASREEVLQRGESLVRSLRRVELVKSDVNFSLALVSE